MLKLRWQVIIGEGVSDNGRSEQKAALQQLDANNGVKRGRALLT